MWGDGGATLTQQATIYTDGPVYGYLRPDADVSDGLWTNELGNNTGLFSSVNASSPSDDTNLILSGIQPVADTVRLRLPDPVGGVSQPFKVRYRYRCVGGVNLTVRLYQGASLIATWVVSGTSSDWVTTTQALTAPQFAAITDFTDLFIELQADAA